MKLVFLHILISISAEEFGSEDLGDCYSVKGNKQLSASYYRKCLSKESVDNRNRVEKKLKGLNT